MAESTALERVEPTPAVLSLIDGPDPQAAVAYAARISEAIAGVLKPKNGYEVISGRKHITIEGWQTMAAMTGHRVEVEWSRIAEGLPATERGLYAWEARAVVRDQSGNVVASGESMADPNERDALKKWASGGNFAVRSMAQTRAMSRALSSRMRYIVQLAGFSGTPAEEMGGVGGPQAPSARDLAKARYRIMRDQLGVEGEQLKAAADLAEGLADETTYARFVWSAAGGALPEEPAEEGEVVEEGADAQPAAAAELTEVEQERMLARWAQVREAAGSEEGAFEVAKEFDVLMVEDILDDDRWARLEVSISEGATAS